jgi:type IV secretion system protein VirD4
MNRVVAIFCRLVLIAACVVFGLAVLILSFRFPLAPVAFLAVVAWKSKQWRGGGWSHGTASFGNMLTFYRNAFFGQRGLLIGLGGYASPPKRGEAAALLLNPFVSSRTAVLLFLAAWSGRKWGREIPLKLNNYTHVCVFGPSGRGKGISLVVPTCLSHPGSMCIVDQKNGELFKLTAEARRKFGPVIRLDGFNVCGPGSMGFNPVRQLNPDADDFLDGCADLANMNIIRTGREQDGQHFLDMAQNDLASVLAFVRACEPNPAKCNFQTIRDIISSPDRLTEVMELMPAIEPLSRQASQMRWPKDRERGSIMSTLTRMTAWLDSAAIRAHTSVVDGFDPMCLRTPGTTVYLCGDLQRTNGASLLRLQLGWTLRKLCENGGDPSRPVLFLIDEAGNLGAIGSLDRATTTVRSAGINLFYIFQSYGQLRETYGERATTIIENIDSQIWLGANGIDSGEVISKKAGDQTIRTESYNRSRQKSRPDGYGRDSGSGSTSVSESTTVTEAGRNLIRPDEALRLPSDLALLFHKNLPVLPIQLLRYFDSPLFKRGRQGAPRGLSVSAVFTSFVAIAVSGLMAVAFVVMPVAPPRPVQRAPFPAYSNSPAYGPTRVPPALARQRANMPPDYVPYPAPVRRRAPIRRDSRVFIPIR